MLVTHFGERVREGKYGLNLTREKYAPANKRSSISGPKELYPPGVWDALDDLHEDEDHRTYTDEAVNTMQENALINFDLNMAYFESLEREGFDQAIAKVLTIAPKLKEIQNLTELDGKSGLYLLVLDKYKQAYIGQSQDMRKRIKAHWSTAKPLDRLVFGKVNESILSIDSFRALDTTRIYAWVTSRPDKKEFQITMELREKYLLNRLAGGIPQSGFALTARLVSRPKRQLTN